MPINSDIIVSTATVDLQQTMDESIEDRTYAEKLYNLLVEESDKYLEFIESSKKEMPSLEEFLNPSETDPKAIRSKQLNSLEKFKLARSKLADIKEHLDLLQQITNPYNYCNYLCDMYIPGKHNQKEVANFLYEKIDNCSTFEKEMPDSFMVATMASMCAENGSCAGDGFGTYEQLKMIQGWLNEIGIKSYIFCPTIIKDFFENAAKSNKKIDLVNRDEVKRTFAARKRKALANLIVGAVGTFISYLALMIVGFLPILDYRSRGVSIPGLIIAGMIMGIMMIVLIVGGCKLRNVNRAIKRTIRTSQSHNYSADTMEISLKVLATDRFFASEQGKKFTEVRDGSFKVFKEYDDLKFSQNTKYLCLEDHNLNEFLPDELVNDEELFDLIYDEFTQVGANNYKEAYSRAKAVQRERERDAKEEAFRNEMRRLQLENNANAEASRRRMEAMEEERLEAARRAESIASSAAAAAAAAEEEQAKELAKIRKAADRARKEVEEINFRQRINDYNK